MNYNGKIKTMSKDTRKKLNIITKEILATFHTSLTDRDNPIFRKYKISQKFYNQTFEELGTYLYNKHLI